VALGLSLIAVFMFMTANIGFYLGFKNEIVKDQVFAKWLKMYPNVNKYLPIIALVVNFKSIKFIYSGFFGMEHCLAQFDDPIKNFYRPLRMISFFSFIFVYIPIVLADIFIFAKVEWGY
jgi:hypothetical protein